MTAPACRSYSRGFFQTDVRQRNHQRRACCATVGPPSTCCCAKRRRCGGLPADADPVRTATQLRKTSSPTAAGPHVIIATAPSAPSPSTPQRRLWRRVPRRGGMEETWGWGWGGEGKCGFGFRKGQSESQWTVVLFALNTAIPSVHCSQNDGVHELTWGKGTEETIIKPARHRVHRHPRRFRQEL